MKPSLFPCPLRCSLFPFITFSPLYLSVSLLSYPLLTFLKLLICLSRNSGSLCLFCEHCIFFTEMNKRQCCLFFFQMCFFLVKLFASAAVVHCAVVSNICMPFKSIAQSISFSETNQNMSFSTWIRINMS